MRTREARSMLRQARRVVGDDDGYSLHALVLEAIREVGGSDIAGAQEPHHARMDEAGTAASPEATTRTDDAPATPEEVAAGIVDRARAARAGRTPPDYAPGHLHRPRMVPLSPDMFPDT